MLTIIFIIIANFILLILNRDHSQTDVREGMSTLDRGHKDAIDYQAEPNSLFLLAGVHMAAMPAVGRREREA